MDRSSDGRRLILAALRRAMVLGVGSVLIVQERTEDFVKQAIEKGQEAQEEGKELVQEMRAQSGRKKPTRIDALDVRINNTLKRLDIATQKDMEGLNQHIIELAEHIDELT